MSNTSIFRLSILFVVAVGALFMLRLAPVGEVLEKEAYLTLNGVKGIEVQQAGKAWTLSFDQQNNFIALINNGERIGVENLVKDPSLFPFGAITAYQFDRPNIVFTPIAQVGDDIVFQVPALIQDGYIQNKSGKKLYDLLVKTYD